MNTEELEQTTSEGLKSNTAALIAVSIDCLNDSSKSLAPVHKPNTSSVSLVSLPNNEAQPCCTSSSERENSGFSIFR